MAFQTGDLRGAERHYQDALNAYPNYVRAVASLGRVRAALGDSAGGIQQYEKAMRIIPDPVFAAALGDLYKLTGRSQEAAQQYTLVEQIGRLNEFNGSLYNRQLILFYADHDLKPGEAYQSAAQEYVVRRDIYGADALAWSALKAGKTAEARSAIKDALRLGTIDARLFYHAGLIAQAAGDRASAHEYLQKALSINPKFDPCNPRLPEGNYDSESVQYGSRAPYKQAFTIFSGLLAFAVISSGKLHAGPSLGNFTISHFARLQIHR